MNIPKTAAADNRQIVDNSPTSVEVFYRDGSRRDTAFPGWAALHHAADREDVVLGREGDCVRVFCVHPAHALEFWGIA